MFSRLVQRRVAVFFILVCLDALLVVGYILTQFELGSLTEFLDLDSELNLPSAYSALQLGLVSLASACLAIVQFKNKASFQRLASAGSMLFAALALDEFFAIHEKITSRFKDITWLPRFHGNHGLWIPVYFIFGAVLLAVFWRDLRALILLHTRIVVLAAVGVVVYLTGAAGLEIISYQYIRGTELAYLYKAEVALEESFEMLGVTILVFAVLSFAAALQQQKQA